MANTIQSNPVYYSLGSVNSSDNSTVRTVILHRRSGHDGFGVYIGEDIPSGLYIVTVERNSPAADANIQPGDRVLAFNGQPVASIQNNPKEKLMQAATNAHSLALTIKSTDLYRSLELPLVNSSKPNHIDNNQNQNQNIRHFTSRYTIDPATDLEGYVRSLFANENIQILQAGTEQDIKPPAIPPRQSADHPKSLPIHHESKKSRRSHHRRREHSKRISLVNVETQTSIDNDENAHEERSNQSLSKRNNSSHPNMGVNQIVSKNQPSNLTDTSKTENRTSEKDKALEFNGISSSSSSERASSIVKQPVQSQPPGSVQAPEVSNPNRSTTSNGRTAVNPPMMHMADVVTEAMDVFRNKQSVENRSQAPPAQKIEAGKNPPPTIYTSTTGRDQVQPPSRDQSQPTGRNQTQPPGRDQVQPPGRDQSQPVGRDQLPPPPPYTDTTSKHPAVNNQSSANEGSYHVPTGEITQRTTAPPPSNGSSIRQLHLIRQANFQGFGFHIQYNKKYYLVQSVEPNSPAAAANLQPNDVILYINGDKTDDMTHAKFVQIVNSSQTVDFSVQPVNDYLRANPSAVRAQPVQATPAAQAVTNQNDDKNKTGLSKALGKFTHR